ncbi:hypothetical protein AMAG_14836 [Allomyces macrogynus ATCC 38327]|uniref:ethanolamine kinase n=1 Tax=Allomyces macrogynus (strain ATCC 38327) TaxID=578462 RepID=A0A0L0T5E2_ALLM3|nr:hypothetical protein AMAG_14836 [Allomyces macrogynus ATCC 38327]|eukprot:KNE69998.1 hypothetical protein AMAG_14836 [Allomyces macrogynus ATCC 38327]
MLAESSTKSAPMPSAPRAKSTTVKPATKPVAAVAAKPIAPAPAPVPAPTAAPTCPIIASVRRLSYTVDENDLDACARAVGSLISLAPTSAIQSAKVTRCKQGITNKLLRVVPPNAPTYLVRVYGHGTDELIDRDAEVRNMAYLARHKLAPPLHARLNNGLVYGYVHGVPANPEDLADAKVWPAIARHVAEWHGLPLPPTAHPVPGHQADEVEQVPALFATLDRWMAMVCKSFPSGTACHLSIADLAHERAQLESTLLPPSRVAFTHNDLLSGNIILQYAENSDEKVGSAPHSVRFIDYEYGGVGFAAFDIANHFCEWAGFDCEYWRYPDVTTQKAWLREYLAQEQKVPPSDADVDAWQSTVAAYTLAAHLYWTLWALVQASVSDIEFDYAGYAQLRWAEYTRWKATRRPPPPPAATANASAKK